jgi:hypothetical protein
VQEDFHNGIFVLLQPQFNLQSEIVSLTVKLYNNTEHPVFMESIFSTYIQGTTELEETVYPDEIVTIDGFPFASFNDNPTLELKVTVEPEDEDAFEIEKTFKFKPKTVSSTPLWLDQAHPKVFSFEIFRFKETDDEDNDEQEAPEVDTDFLKAAMLGGLNNSKGKRILHGEALNKIDLHIEAITLDFEHLSSTEIMDIQMRTFEQTLERAIAAGEHSLIAIHGVGAGVLKKKILEFCSTHPRVKCCTAPIVNNYGTGATEIFFQ